MTQLLEINQRTIRQAAGLIMRGELVAYPTDTVYGLGCDPLNLQALRKIIQAKKRKQGRLPLLVDTVGKAEEIGRFDEIARTLARKFWPGPLTLVVPMRTHLPEPITGSNDTVGLRIPLRETTMDLIRACGGALVGTSANISGNASLITAPQVARELHGQVKVVLDGGATGSGIESTVVKVEEGHVSILREKAIAKGRILSAMQNGPKLSGMLSLSC